MKIEDMSIKQLLDNFVDEWHEAHKHKVVIFGSKYADEILYRFSTLEEKVKELEEYKADIEEEARMVMSEKCPSDEVHCTCVPLLRQKVKELEGEILH